MTLRRATPPKAASDDAEIHALSGAVPASPIGAIPTDEVTLLAVDGEPAELETVRKLLHAGGYRRVLAARDPAQALELLERHRPDLLLIGHGGANAEVLSLLAQVGGPLRTDDPLPILLLGPEQDPQHRARALKLGVTEFVRKPLAPDELLLRVRNALALRLLHKRALHSDGLTGMTNRQGLRRLLDEAIANAKTEESHCALLYVDLDRFRKINETLGHDAGDTLLRKAAQLLSAQARQLDDTTAALRKAIWNGISIARVSGNGFSLLIGSLQPHLAVENAAHFTHKLHEAFSRPFRVGDTEIYQTISTGIAMYPDDGTDPDTLLACAEAAMQQAKKSGRNGYEFFSGHVSAPRVQRLQMETDLRHALERGELCVYYQPKVELSTMKIVGVEALVRWQHSQHGLISPMVFIPLAEELGLINEIGNWVMTQACMQIKTWTDQGIPPIDVAVNVAGVQLKNQRLWRDVKDVLRATGVNPRQLMLELTESMLMDDAEDSIRMLRELSQIGVKCSVDDFGTGYSSLAYLTRFPLQELKIDRSFVQRMSIERESRAIVSAIILMAHELGMEVVAEGVETTEQLEYLQQRRCDKFQGYLCSRPLPPAELGDLLAHRAAVPSKASGSSGRRRRQAVASN